METLLNRAIAIAAEAHTGQVDKAGAPYILHPLRVMLAVESTEERIVAVLHDVLEDCPAWTAARLVAEGFSPNVISAVMTLTRRKSESYEAFIVRCGADPIARRVKLADLTDNMDASRIGYENMTPSDVARTEKYLRAHRSLAPAVPTRTPQNVG